MAALEEAEIRARIKRARNEAGLSQEQLADLLAVHPKSVQNYENDHVPWRRIRDIAAITGRSAQWLLHGEDAPGGDETLDERLAALEAKLDRLLALSSGEAGDVAESREELAALPDAICQAVEPQRSQAHERSASS